MIDVLCVKVGKKYGPEYVNRLSAMVQRNLTVPHTFNCITDTAQDLNPWINPIFLDNPELNGWWAKMALFKALPGVDSQIVYLDLDTVIIDNIDFLATHNGLAMLRDFYHADHYGSGAMLIDRRHGWIWEKYFDHRGEYAHFYGDQEVIEHLLRGRNERPAILQDLFPGKIVSYKVHCRNKIPAGAAIVCFHGQPKPHEANAGWISKYWKE